MTEKEYREHPAISRSELWKFRESPQKFKYAKEHPPEPTPALLFGQVFHKLALEPETFSEEFIAAPEIDRRTKDGKAATQEFLQAAEGKSVIDAGTLQHAAEMVEALQAALFQDGGQAAGLRDQLRVRVPPRMREAPEVPR